MSDNVNVFRFHNKLMKGKALRKHSLHEKTAASVLLKLFISLLLLVRYYHSMFIHVILEILTHYTFIYRSFFNTVTDVKPTGLVVFYGSIDIAMSHQSC